MILSNNPIKSGLILNLSFVSGCKGKVTAAMVSEATCIACNVKRILKEVTPVARGYVMQSLECPECSELFRIVVRHRRSHASYRAAFVDSDDFRDSIKR